MAGDSGSLARLAAARQLAPPQAPAVGYHRRVRWPARLLVVVAAAVCAQSCGAILGIPDRETDPNLVCAGPDDCACVAPFADCDSPDVCDVDTRTDPMNCGACGVDCEGEPCVDGQCGCIAPFDNCEDPASCSIDTSSDPQHCGACGVDCNGYPCDAGVCGCDQLPCKLVGPQCGCGAAQACGIGPVSADNPTGRVCEQAGDVEEGEPCGGVARCAAGLICMPASDSTNACRRFCDADDLCLSGELGQPSCGVTLEYDSMDVPDALVCSDDCDPFDDVGCPDDGKCLLVGGDDGDPRGYTFCNTTGPGSVGDPCTTALDCGSGMICNAGNMQCSRLCSDQHPCGGGDTCDPVIVVGTLEVGVCI